MAPHPEASMSSIGRRRSRASSASSVESAVASTSKMSDSMSMPPLTRSRTDSVSSSSSQSSLASTASIRSASSRSRSRSPVRPTNTGGEPTSPRGTQNGKVTRRRKAPKLTMSKTKRTYRPRKDAIKKILREEANSHNFILSDLDWSHWKQVIRRKAPQQKVDEWERRHPDHVGYRRHTFSADSDLPGVYEFAVVTPEQRKVPVLGSVSMGINGRHWEGAMLSKPKLRTQIDRVLRRGCKLYARKARFSARDMPSIYDKCPVERKVKGRVTTEEAVNELRGLMMKVHDYAWRDHYDIESRTYSHRPLVVDGVRLSD